MPSASDTLINTATPHILYIDLDSCFATAQQQANPLLRGKPMVVAAYATDKGCILSPSIEAKRLGIKTGMRVWEARQRVPGIVVCPPDTDLYRDIHYKFRAVLEQFCPVVIAKSIDEAVLDFSGMDLTTDRLLEIGATMKQQIRRQVGCWISSSVGIATNRILAKLGASLRKPDGLVAITADTFRQVYATAKLTDFAGINTRTEFRLATAGIWTPLQFFDASYETLRHTVFRSVLGYYWFLRLRGWEVDGAETQRKTYGQQYALSKQTDDPREIMGILLKLTEKMGRRLRRADVGAKGILVACRHTDHTDWHGGKRFDRVLSTTVDLYEAVRLIMATHPGKKRMALLSVTSFSLVPRTYYQEELFVENTQKKLTVSRALDAINDRFGEYTIFPARMMGMDDRVIDRIAFGKSAIDG